MGTFTNRLTNQSSHFRQTQLNYNPSFRYLFLYCELSFSSQSWIAAATWAVILLTRLATVLRRELQLATTAEPKDTSVANALQLLSQSPATNVEAKLTLLVTALKPAPLAAVVLAGVVLAVMVVLAGAVPAGMPTAVEVAAVVVSAIVAAVKVT